MILILSLRGVSVFGCCMAVVWFDVTQVVVLFVYVDKCGWVSQQAWAFHPAQTESVAPCLPGVGVLLCGCCVMLVCTGHPPNPNWKCCPMPTGCWCVGVWLLCDASMHGASTQPKLKVLPHAYRVLVCWCVGVLVCWCVGVFVCWCVGVLVCWCVGVLVCWCVGVLVCWCVGVLLCWCIGVWLLCSASMHGASTQPRLKVLPHAYRVLVCWCIGMLVCWCISVLVCWCVGVLVYGCCVMLVCTDHPPSPNWQCCPMPTGCWCVVVLLCCCVVVLLCCCVVVLLCCCVVVLVCWCVGVLVCCCVGGWVCWCVVVLVCWCMVLCDASVCRVSTQPNLTVLSRAYWVLVCWCMVVVWCEYARGFHPA